MEFHPLLLKGLPVFSPFPAILLLLPLLLPLLLLLLLLSTVYSLGLHSTMDKAT